MSYLFLSDLDGSILNDEKIITKDTMDSLKFFVENGGRFAICTGRDLNSAKSVYDNLGVDFKGSFVVAYNGGQIYDVDKQETIYRVGIDPALVEEIFKMAREYDIYVQTYNDDFILSERYCDCLEFYRRVIKTPVILHSSVMPFVNVPPCKIICIELHDHAKQERFREAVVEKYGDILNLMYSNDYYLELIPKESGKGSALVRLRDHLGIKPENVIACGDGDNDLEMIKYAGLGIGMINGSENVKNAADVVTETDNNHDGLAPILRGFIEKDL